jgi:hypothetical protein
MIDSQTESDIRDYASERGFRAATLERWLELASGDAVALWDLTRELRLGENQMRDLWDWSEEIAARDGTSITAVLAHESVKATRMAAGRGERLKALKAALRRLRFPALVQVEDRIATLTRTLGLPRNVRLTVPEYLEGDEIRIEIVAADAASLRAAAEKVASTAATPACEEIFELLSGAAYGKPSAGEPPRKG